MAARGEELFAARRLPYLRGSILARRGEARAVGRPGHLPHSSRMAVVGEETTPTHRIPDLDGTVVATRGDGSAIRRPGYAIDCAQMPGVGDAPLPGCPSHTWMVLSLPTEAMRVPSGDHATAKTVLVCP